MKDLFNYSPDFRKKFNLYFSLIAVITLFLIMEITYQILFEERIVVISHLFYFPIVLCSFFLPKRGVIISTFLAMIYLILINYMIPGVYEIVSSTMQFYVYISISITISLISERIQQERKKFSSIFNYSKSGICLFNTKTGEIVDKNQKYEDLIQKSPILNNLYTISSACTDKNHKEFIENLEKKNSVQDCEIKFNGEDGRENYAIITASLIPGDFAVLTISDITEIRSYQEEIASLNSDLSAANEKANMYLDILIHDINNANTASMGYAELIKESIPESDDIYFEKMMAGIKHSSNIISNVTRIRELHNSGPKAIPVSLKEKIDSAIAEYPDLNVNSTQESSKVAAGPLLEDIFSIILENSLNYGGKGTHVSIETRDEGDYTYIEISDDGPGVPDTKKENLFKRFQPGWDGRRGKGLGLPVCWYILNKYGGDISATDRVEGDPKSGLKIIIKLIKA